LIYLVEDEEGIRDLVLYTLEKSGLEARGFDNSRPFWEALGESLPDLVILDIMLPGEDGLGILKRLRERPSTGRIPVMMLSARGAEYDKVLGLERGADDYLAKPVGMMELLARVRSLLRRAGMNRAENGGEEYRSGGLYVSAARHVAAVEGREILLTLKEFDLLLYLLKHSGMVLSREQILASVWNYEQAAETRTVDTHILTLRAKLGSCASLIRTVRGVGYKADSVLPGAVPQTAGETA
jgi:two-component system alkaline phosphatase synthesis response regulator PhoP